MIIILCKINKSNRKKYKKKIAETSKCQIKPTLAITQIEDSVLIKVTNQNSQLQLNV
jgi:hypothetical protein